MIFIDPALQDLQELVGGKPSLPQENGPELGQDWGDLDRKWAKVGQKWAKTPPSVSINAYTSKSVKPLFSASFLGWFGHLLPYRCTSVMV